ncbi:hypothetical protein Tco_0772149 [Tanacetum coccineum]|uniref:Zf-CCHC domain-containing protein/UBN2 domain-containing protein n=1 Tax=Tanacetum coccineum TaxID=301880 RepID=A0ABQ4ZL25_9ASTR
MSGPAELNLSPPTSAVRNTVRKGNEQISKNPNRPASDAALREYCYKSVTVHHECTVHQEKVQQEKLKEVKARLNFEGCSRRNSKVQEVSPHSESRTPNVGGEHRRGRRFNTIITSLKALDESFSSRNHVRKLLRALPTKWRPKVMAIEESKDLSTLPLDELIGNLKVYEVVLEKDLEDSKSKKEKYKSLALKARKFLSEEEATSSDSDDEDGVKEDKKEKYDRKCFKCGDPNHFISDYPKHSFNDQKAFVVGCWSDSGDDCKKEEICLMTLDDNEVLSDTPYYSSSYLDNESWENEYDKLCKISLKIIQKSKQLKAKNEELKREACELKAKNRRTRKKQRN